MRITPRCECLRKKCEKNSCYDIELLGIRTVDIILKQEKQNQSCNHCCFVSRYIKFYYLPLLFFPGWIKQPSIFFSVIVVAIIFLIIRHRRKPPNYRHSKNDIHFVHPSKLSGSEVRTMRHDATVSSPSRPLLASQ